MRRFGTWIAVVLLLAMAAQLIFSVTRQTATFDEPSVFGAGLVYLLRHDFRMSPDHPPLASIMTALPLLFLEGSLPSPAAFSLTTRRERVGAAYGVGSFLLYGSRAGADRVLFWTRLPTVIMALLLAWLVYRWSKSVYGEASGLVSLALCAFCPNVLAHGSLATHDLPLALFFFATTYAFWLACQKPTPARISIVGILLGLALSSKHPALVLVPVLPSLALWQRSWTPGKAGRRVRPLAVKWVVLLFALAVMTLAATYGFVHFKEYFAGLSHVLEHRQGEHPAFLLGNYSVTGWFGYYPIAFLLKTPLGFLGLLLAAAFCRARVRSDRNVIVFLLVPPTALSLLMVLGRVNLGVRYLLPAFPFLFVLAGGAAARLTRRETVRVAAVACLTLAAVGSSLRSSPYHIAYFNELVGGPANGYRYLADSNVDWGQELKTLKRYMDVSGIEGVYLSYFGTGSPAYYGINYQYLPSEGSLPFHKFERPPPLKMVVASVHCIQGVNSKNHQLLAWLKKYDPIARIGYSMLVYDFTQNRDARLALVNTYRESAGMKQLAQAELDDLEKDGL